MVEPIVFKKGSHRKCILCNDKEINEWLSESLRMTLEGGHERPPARQIHETMKETFPDRSPNSATSVRAHLSDHEPLWRAFSEESETVR